MGKKPNQILDRHDCQIRADEALALAGELPPGSEINSYSGWSAIRQLATRLTNDKRADRVISLPSLLGGGLGH